MYLGKVMDKIEYPHDFLSLSHSWQEICLLNLDEG
jgi:hypothetical protein